MCAGVNVSYIEPVIQLLDDLGFARTEGCAWTFEAVAKAGPMYE